MSAITAKASRKMKKYAVLTRESRCFLGSFDFSWEQRKVSDMFKVTRGYVLAATLTNDTKSDEMPYPVYSSQTKDFGLMGYYRDYLYENSITWTTDGANAGTVNYRAGKFYCTNVCGVLLSDKVNASQMIAEALNNVAKGYVSYVGNPKLMNNVMSDIEIMIPVSPMEQKRISDYFATLDHLITLHQRKCALLFSSFQALISIMFTTSTFSWEQRKAIDIADYSKGNGYSKGDLTDAGTPIILYGRLYTKYQFAISEVDTFAVPRNGAVYSQGNEVIVPASGETAEDIARASAVEKSGVLLGGDLNILRPFDFINPLFLALAISNGEPQKELAKKAQGKSVVHIHNTDIQEVTIAYPSRTEQDRIVSVFRQLDHLITLHQRQPFLHSTPVIYPIAQLITVFYTSSWEQRKLRELALFNPKDELPQTFEYVDLESVVGTEMLSHRTEAKSSAPSRAQRLAHTGDLFYQTVRPYQKNNYLFEKPGNNYVFSTGYAQMRPYIDGYFLLSLVQSDRFVKVVLDNCTGTSYPAINANDLAEIEVAAPLDENEAQKIGTIFRNLDNLITLHQRKGKAAVSGCFLNCSSIEKVRR